MPTRQHFLKAINAAPHNVALRLQFADWLEEQGDPLCDEWRKPMSAVVILWVECDRQLQSRFARGDGDLNRWGRGDGSGDGCTEAGLTGDGSDYEFGDGEGDGCYLE